VYEPNRETNAGEIACIRGAAAGGLSYLSSGSVGSGLGETIWLEAAVISSTEMTELSRPARNIPKDNTA